MVPSLAPRRWNAKTVGLMYQMSWRSSNISTRLVYVRSHYLQPAIPVWPLVACTLYRDLLSGIDKDASVPATFGGFLKVGDVATVWVR